MSDEAKIAIDCLTQLTHEHAQRLCEVEDTGERVPDVVALIKAQNELIRVALNIINASRSPHRSTREIEIVTRCQHRNV